MPLNQILELTRQPQMREQHTELVIQSPFLQQVGHRPIETRCNTCRVGRARTVCQGKRQECGEQRERQAQ